MKDRGTCEICNAKPAQYTCPMCMRKYCDSTCFKGHKENNDCQSEDLEDLKDLVKRHTETEPPPQAAALEYGEEGEDFIPFERLIKLESSEEIMKLLEDQSLRDMIRALSRSSNPEKLLRDCMQEEIFVQFANECLHVTGED